jgi:hypothetical protein
MYANDNVIEKINKAMGDEQDGRRSTANGCGQLFLSDPTE